MLIMANTFQFKDELIKGRRDGGLTAAKKLQEAVCSLEPFRSQSKGCRLVVRIYANTLHLSKELHRAGVIGGDARSISPFIAGFNSSNASFEFVDAGDQREDVTAKVQSKIRSSTFELANQDVGMFNLTIEDPRCAHVLFAGCHSLEYMTVLETHWQKVEKFSLIAAGPIDDTYTSIGLDIDDLSSVFQFSSNNVHESNLPSRPQNCLEIRVPDKPKAQLAAESGRRSSTNSPLVCKYFARVSPARGRLRTLFSNGCSRAIARMA